MVKTKNFSNKIKNIYPHSPLIIYIVLECLDRVTHQKSNKNSKIELKLYFLAT